VDDCGQPLLPPSDDGSGAGGDAPALPPLPRALQAVSTLQRWMALSHQRAKALAAVARAKDGLDALQRRSQDDATSQACVVTPTAHPLASFSSTFTTQRTVPVVILSCVETSLLLC